MEDDTLRKMLNAPVAPDTLAVKLYNDLEIYANTKVKSAWFSRWWFMAGAPVAAAAALLAAWLTLSHDAIPPVIVSAQKHMLEEAGLSGVIDTEYMAWFKAHAIQPPPESVPIALVKNCTVKGEKAKHLRFEFAGGGVMNIFIFRCVTPPRWVGARGGADNRRWVTFQPSERVAVIVLFDDAAPKNEVNKVLNTMFPEATGTSV